MAQETPSSQSFIEPSPHTIDPEFVSDLDMRFILEAVKGATEARRSTAKRDEDDETAAWEAIGSPKNEVKEVVLIDNMHSATLAPSPTST